MANTNGAVNLGGDLDYDSLDDVTKQKLAQAAAEHNIPAPEPETMKATTAFILAVNENNDVAIIPDLTTDITAERVPTSGDIKLALTDALDFIKAQQVAQVTQQAMLQMSQAMSQQAAMAQQEKSIREKLGL